MKTLTQLMDEVNKINFLRLKLGFVMDCTNLVVDVIEALQISKKPIAHVCWRWLEMM